MPDRLPNHPGRLLASVTSAAVAAALLTGCGGGGSSLSGPTVTLQAAAASVSSQPVNYVRNGKLVSQKPPLQTLPVRPGGTLRVSVDREIAARGWLAQLGDKIVVSKRTSESATVQLPARLPTDQRVFSVLSAPVGKGNRASGLWVFALAPSG